MVEITNRSNSGEVKYTDANYEMTGDFRQDPSTNNVKIGRASCRERV